MQPKFTIQPLKSLLLILAAILISLNANAMFKWNAHQKSVARKATFEVTQVSNAHSASLYRHSAFRERHAFRTANAYNGHSGSRKGPGFGIASLVSGFGAIAMCLFIFGTITAPPVAFAFVAVLGVNAIVCGAIGIHREGKGMAIAGLCMGIGAIVLGFSIMALIELLMSTP